MTRALVFLKNGRKYGFRYPPGSEDKIIDSMLDLAEDSNSGVSYLDVAYLSFCVGLGAVEDFGRGSVSGLED